MKKAISLFLILMFSLRGFAGTLELRIPKGNRLVIKNKTYQCFDLEEYKKILELNADYSALETKCSVLGEVVEETKKKVGLLGEQLELKDISIRDLKIDRDRIYNDWLVADKKWREEEAKPRFSLLAGWSFIGVTIGLSVLLVVVLVRK